MLNKGIFGLALAALASMASVAHAVPVDDASFMPPNRQNSFLFGPQALAQSFTIENTGELVEVLITVSNDNGGTVTLVFELRDESGLFDLSLPPLASATAMIDPGEDTIIIQYGSIPPVLVTVGDVLAVVQPGTGVANVSWFLGIREVNSVAPVLYPGGKAYKAQSSDLNTVQPIDGDPQIDEAQFHFLVRVEPAIAVPAPASALLLGVGLVALAGVTRHRR
jgi:hypothetical protein